MPKFAVEVDTDEKTTAFTIDGRSVDIKEFSASQYTYSPCDGKTDKTCSYVSWTLQKDTNEKISYSISFDNSGGSSETYSINNYSISKELGKTHQDAIAAVKIARMLGKKEPVLVVNVEDWTNFTRTPDGAEPTFNKAPELK